MAGLSVILTHVLKCFSRGSAKSRPEFPLNFNYYFFLARADFCQKEHVKNILKHMSMALSACLSAAIALILQGAAASAEMRLLYSVTAPVARLEGLAADLDTAEVSDFLVPMQAADVPPEGARRRKPVMGRAEVMRGGLVLPQIGQPVPRFSQFPAGTAPARLARRDLSDVDRPAGHLRAY